MIVLDLNPNFLYLQIMCSKTRLQMIVHKHKCTDKNTRTSSRWQKTFYIFLQLSKRKINNATYCTTLWRNSPLCWKQ